MTRRKDVPVMGAPASVLPGSAGEHAMQQRFGTARRATRFYETQMLDHVNDEMAEFIGRMEMVFVATADAHGEADCSFRAGLPGFVRVLAPRVVAYPEYRGNGVMASLGNVVENGHVGLLFIDFFRDTVGLHVNGRARVVENDAVVAAGIMTPEVVDDVMRQGGRRPERWVVVDVVEAYVHCSKHIPLLAKADKAIAWGTDDEARKGGDYFAARHADRPWRGDAAPGGPRPLSRGCALDDDAAA